jgi:hypothetical protein
VVPSPRERVWEKLVALLRIAPQELLSNVPHCLLKRRGSVQHRSWLEPFTSAGRARLGTALAILVSIGLVMYVASVLIGLGLLIWDATLALSNKTTITDWSAASWWRIALISGGIFLGWVGINLHLILNKLLNPVSP